MNIDDNGNENGDQKLFKSEFSNVVSMWQILSVCSVESDTLD